MGITLPMRFFCSLLLAVAASAAQAQSSGLTENLTLGGFRLAPNPAQTQVTILPAATDVHLFVLFYDASGRNVLSADLRGPLTIDVSELPDGAYMVGTMNDRGTPLDVHRLVIAR
ncbi:MAG: T9SS type A sorting domain-containing protein [Bacteroidetes bacterium]|nr:T9SS type A sorting domain-containing protein [Bacteroidota bacterium]